MKSTVLVLLVLLLAAAVAPSAVRADTASDEAAIRAMLDEMWKKIAAKKYDAIDLNPHGSWQATSQGGLWKRVNREGQKTLLNESPNTLDMAANHVEVTFLGSKKDVAYATFYLTGTIKLADGNTIPNYRTRASWAMEKIEGSWVVSGAHYSPLFGGSGVRFE
jgi:hypothetical protein